MVHIINYKKSTSNDGKDFILLKVQGGLEPVQSMNTGKIYVKAKTAYVASNLDETTAKAMLGTQMQGQIIRETCEPYDYVVKDTGETITLNHRYTYSLNEEVAQVPSKLITSEMGMLLES